MNPAIVLLFDTVDGRNLAPPNKPWNDDSPVNTNNKSFPMVSKWCRILSIHSMGVVSFARACLTMKPLPGR